MPRKLTAVATISALALSVAPALTQTGGTSTPVQPTQDHGAEQPPGATDQGSESMREMMREMMQEMMQRRQGADGGRSDRVERRSGGRWHHGGRMGRPEMMEGRGMMRGSGRGMRSGMMHGAGMRMMFAIVDADSDGALSLAELQDFQGRIFHAIDENGDGSVEMEEIEAFFHGSDEESAQ